MSLYSIYKKSNPRSNDYKTVMVKQGYSIYAMLFGSLWCVYHKIWSLFIITLSINIFIISYPFANNINAFILNIFVNICMLLLASDFRELSLRCKGFVLDDIIFAVSDDEAEVKYLSRCGLYTKNNII